MCVASNKVTLKTGAWLYGEQRTCVETTAVSRGTSHVTTRERCNHGHIYRSMAVTTLVDIQNTLCKATVTHSESHTTTAQCVCSEAESSAVVAIVKRLGFNFLFFLFLNWPFYIRSTVRQLNLSKNNIKSQQTNEHK